MSEKLSIFKELMNATIFLAFTTSLLYISGVSFLDAYLIDWGVESSLIRSNTQEILVQGAIVWFVGGIKLIVPALLLVVLIFLPLYTITEISKFPFVRRIALGIYKFFKSREPEGLEPPYILQSIIKGCFYIFLLIAFLIIFLFSFYRLLDFSASQGKEKAVKEYKEFSSNFVSTQGLFSRKKVLTINGTEKEGYILANSDSLAVLYLLASASKPEQVLVIPLSAINQIKGIKNGTIKNGAS